MWYMHSGKVGCNTVEYTRAFLYSDWLYFLQHGLNVDICIQFFLFFWSYPIQNLICANIPMLKSQPYMTLVWKLVIWILKQCPFQFWILIAVAKSLEIVGHISWSHDQLFQKAYLNVVFYHAKQVRSYIHVFVGIAFRREFCADQFEASTSPTPRATHGHLTDGENTNWSVYYEENMSESESFFCHATVEPYCNWVRLAGRSASTTSAWTGLSWRMIINTVAMSLIQSVLTRQIITSLHTNIMKLNCSVNSNNNLKNSNLQSNSLTHFRVLLRTVRRFSNRGGVRAPFPNSGLQ